jgi:hypothetical protein
VNVLIPPDLADSFAIASCYSSGVSFDFPVFFALARFFALLFLLNRSAEIIAGVPESSYLRD